MAYTGSKVITIDHTKCGTGNTSGFPMLFSGVYSYLAGTGHGGAVTNSSGYDIIFTSDSAGLTLLNWEIDTYDPVTGTVNIWVTVPTLSVATNTVIYIFYGNSAITTFQGGATGAAWDSGYTAVFHFGDGSTYSPADSTSYVNSGTNHGAVAATGKIGGASQTNGSSQYFIWPASANQKAAQVWAGNLTIEAWYYLSSQTSYPALFDSPTDKFCLFIPGTTEVYTYIQNSPNNLTGLTGFTTGTWHHLVWTRTGLGVNDCTLYLDGQQKVQFEADGFSSGAQTAQFYLGTNPSGGGSAWTGLVDEFRASNVFRTASYVTASFNNQSSPSTFYALTFNPTAFGPNSLMMMGIGV